ncbi:MAG TPA: hypothetical protein VMV72_00140 [Verrucomicrobiae bacterium]|nr:hypothetical protein [Verrucomicrobiae bacterium]
MSDTIDATVQPAARLESVAASEAGAGKRQVPARDYVRLAQGFYFVFGGLLVTVLMGAQLLLLSESSSFAELFLGLGVLGTLIGTWRLYQVRSLGDAWRSRTRATLALAGLMAYFCVFVYLWRRAPECNYLLGNVIAFAATGILYITAFNRAVAALAAELGRKDMALESRVLGTGNIGLLVLPFAGIIGYIVASAVWENSSLLSELRFVLSRANLLVIILLLLPFSLTLSLAWGCKDAVLRRLSNLDRADGGNIDEP